MTNNAIILQNHYYNSWTLMIERTHLTILLAIERKGSLTAAAESLHLTQSALSHTIKKLEQQMGVRLWQKEGRKLRFTDAGNYLLLAAQRLLPQLERLDDTLFEYADGNKGSLRIGMECHPCYQWLLKVVKPYLSQWPQVDVDVKQRFQFGGMAALFNHDIDILVTPDPLRKKGIVYTPVFDYEQVLVVHKEHPLASKHYATPEDITSEVLFTYPVETSRLDIYTLFLTPAQCAPKQCKAIEATDIMLQMVASKRGVAALPKWLVEEYIQQLPITSVRLGKEGIMKQIFLGTRENDDKLDYMEAFLTLAKEK